MKRRFCSIFAFIITFIMIFSSTIPAVAVSISGMESPNNSSTFQNPNIPVSERYHIIENGYRGKYPLQEGIFGYQSAEQENKNSVYFYSDGYFEDAPEQYNESLATMSLSLAFSCFNAKRTSFDMNLPSGSYSNLFRNVKLLMSDIGIEDKNILINDNFDIRPNKETVGMIMGAKQIALNGKEYLLIPIAVRGGDYESEWASNFTLGDSGEALGFSNAATKVVEQIESYINSNGVFDISSALDEGKVKFWIVGYSRGGAVANLTAKRLTDIYGKTGNSIYAYTFEAPSAGVDSEEINVPWTHGGIYKNIHNIINPGDLVALIPPKQMGFKRYGVDHYIPGTDAGEVITSTYETPTKITVTTHADNVAYIVGDANYNERRPKMLSHLEAIDSTILFSDDFSLNTLDLWGAITGGELFSPAEEWKNVSTAIWLQIFTNDLQSWAANGTYSKGEYDCSSYNNDFRNFYTSHTVFAGKERVTPETAIACILELVYLNYYNEEFLDALLYRALSMLEDDSNLLDLFFDATQKWDDLSKFQQNKNLDTIWNTLDGDLSYKDGSPVKKISDFVGEDERNLLRDSVYTLSYFLFLFSSKDFEENPSLDGINATGVHLITLISNVMTVAYGHYPEICLSWLRTYDENYSPDRKDTKFTKSEVNLINDGNNLPPEIESKIDFDGETITVSLNSIVKSNQGVDKNSINNGSAIYYAVFENGNMLDDWKLYREPIVIDSTAGTSYSVKAYATRLMQMSEVIELSDEELRADSPYDPDENGNQNGSEKEIPQTNEPPSQIDNYASEILIILGVSLILVSLSLFIIIKKRKNK